MAIMATGGSVPPRQREARLLCVVEAPKRPAVWIVARFASRAHAALVMRIVVAGSAGEWSTLERRTLVAGFARHRRMQANQRKLRQIVVESYFFAPARCVVARLAARAELAFMSIVLIVARAA